ncbi:hypothetical protein BRW65_14225 [Mycobacterium paraffinicum]|uniref:CD-NTase associated protein 4-like DNA endonuclease domain-containing protein n=1 Tax=Mycobacterium paraffinicum TaxID=53378 RepID=A0A1Q4HTQ4_9MYCO|nr:hypothetical protein BRW65_14225 [Mycobacterium paraffinicum]
MGDDEIAAFAGIQADDTGTATFQRFEWQAKLAVRAWLLLLTDAAMLAVVCEHLEDLAIVETTGFRFAQLKTRDKGSWSTAKICAKHHAVDRLATSYLAAEAAGIVHLSRFEVWLEGPPSEERETTAFFADPTSATAAIKRKIREFGLNGAKLSDFLERLSIHCHQPHRQTIDAVVIRTIGALWPALTMGEVEHLYEDLLSVAESAQRAELPPLNMMEALRAAQSEPVKSSVWDPVALKLLLPAQLRAVCPPLSADGIGDLLTRAAAGEASVLELKLARAGATTSTIQSALLARADADVVATKGRASGVITDVAEDALDKRLLTMAGSVAAVAASTAGTIQRPAEFIYHSLISNAANTAALDVDNLYRRDHRLIVGHLCGVSDQCRYGWGMT